MTTSLIGRNQITVPAEIARKLGLTPGARFDRAVSEQPNRIVITIKPTRKQLLERVRELGRKAKRPGVDEVAEFVRERTADDNARQDLLK